MKQKIHPNYAETKIVCNGCKTTYQTRSTVEDFAVEICANCHPFYTGKQKLVDVAGRVDRFKARQAAAAPPKSSRPKLAKKVDPKTKSRKQLSELKNNLQL